MNQPLVQIRTPTYKRPDQLRRCLKSMKSQTWENWICHVYDDDPEQSGRDVIQAMHDSRISYVHNSPQKFASRNIDSCFSKSNPYEADYFCVVEDDNTILPSFIEDNIRLCDEHQVEIILRNQLIEYESGTDNARLSSKGILEEKYHEGLYDPDTFRLSLLADIGVSNGGLFWSKDAVTDLEIGVDCTATLQEYMRTYAIAEPIYVALNPLAVWAENGDQTTRDLGSGVSYLRRELDLKRSIQQLQRHAWRAVNGINAKDFILNEDFLFDPKKRATGLIKSLISLDTGNIIDRKEKLRLYSRGVLIQLLGRRDENLEIFIKECSRQAEAEA